MGSGLTVYIEGADDDAVVGQVLLHQFEEVLAGQAEAAQDGGDVFRNEAALVGAPGAAGPSTSSR